MNKLMAEKKLTPKNYGSSVLLNMIDIIVESCFLAIHSLIIVLCYDDTVQDVLDTNGRNVAGNCIIICCICSLGINIIMMVREQIFVFKSLYLKIKNHLAGNKVE